MVGEAARDVVTQTYLHLPGPEHFRPALLVDPDVLVLEAREPLPAFYRFLYGAVGRQYRWVDRLGLAEDELRAAVWRPGVTLLVLYLRGTPAGYLELVQDAEPGEPGTEMRYLGVIPAFQGRGLGKHLLSLGVQRAFADGAGRVWLSTLTSDGPHALANYQARGFLPYRTRTVPSPQAHPEAGS